MAADKLAEIHRKKPYIQRPLFYLGDKRIVITQDSQNIPGDIKEAVEGIARRKQHTKICDTPAFHYYKQACSDDRPTGNHPGNIIAEESLAFILGKVKKHVRVITFRNRDGKRRTNHIYNKKYKGYAAQITYDYLDNYDADVEDE